MTLTSSGSITQIAPYAGAIVSALIAYSSWRKKPVIEFGIVTATKGNLVGRGKRAAFSAVTLRVQIKKVRGEGKAEKCEAFLTIQDSSVRSVPQMAA